MTIRDDARHVVEFLIEDLDVDLCTADLLDALAVHGLTIVPDMTGEMAAAYQEEIHATLEQ